jgi:hypothetical protein
MALLYNPLYQLYVNLPVAQSIWDLHNIYIWQILLTNLGKIQTFMRLMHRYEKKHCEKQALIFLLAVFAISYGILVIMKWIESRRIVNIVPQAQSNGDGNDGNSGTDNGNSHTKQITNANKEKNEKSKPENGNNSNNT